MREGAMGQGRVFSASILMTMLVVAAHCTSAQADSFTCNISPTVAYVDGQAQQFSTGPVGPPCIGVVDGTHGGVPANPTLSTVHANVSASPDHIGVIMSAQGNATIDVGVTETDTVVRAFIPTSLLALIYGPGATAVQLGDITYNLSGLGLSINGDSLAVVTNSAQATGVYTDEHASASIIGTSESDATEIGPCGGSTSVCQGINSGWVLTLSVHDLSTPGPVVTLIPDGAFISFSITMSERVMLNTIGGVATSPVEVDAFDPFEITGMALVDANGQVLPGITFTDGDGFVFPSEPSLGTLPDTTVPEPASIAIFGAAFIGLFGLRRFITSD
jgi:hypothetical protein